MAASLVEQLGVDALLPGPPLIHQRAVQPAQGPHLHHVCWRDPRLRQPALQQHGAASAAQMRSAAHALCNSTVTGNNTWVTLHGRQRARYGRSGSLSPRSAGPGHTPSRPTHRPGTSGSRSHQRPTGTRRGQHQPLPSPSVPPSTTARHPASRPRLQRGAAHSSVPRHTDGAHEQDQPRHHTDRHIGSRNDECHPVVVIQRDGQHPSAPSRHHPRSRR